MHIDYIGYYPLRALEDYGINVRVHKRCLPRLKQTGKALFMSKNDFCSFGSVSNGLFP